MPSDWGFGVNSIAVRCLEKIMIFFFDDQGVVCNSLGAWAVAVQNYEPLWNFMKNLFYL